MIAQRINFYGEKKNERRTIELLYIQCPICDIHGLQDIKFAVRFNAVAQDE